ncbi:Rap1a/Tai family immunity protein [Aristophania vespae]|uniref:Rap1a/Tai family immunity protein n=1 Tax=Aristophania vespae TaxID=2697033 RepID=UPI002351348A|nr:Rap1a/Tai family immunity protein [Aristophania vespae]UMM63059.1 hypothetical protein DM15PD_00120 [Aristophania vespae]
MRVLTSALFAGALAVCSFSALPDSAHAQRVSKLTGKALGQMCTSKNGQKLCNAYLTGILDSEVWSRDYAVFNKDAAPVAFCVSPQKTMSQIRDTVVSWLKGNNDALSQPAGKAVYRALHETYPCGAKVKTNTPSAKGEMSK